MYYFYIAMMSARVFHSSDMNGLDEALTDTPGPRRARPKPPRLVTVGGRLTSD